MRNKNKNVKMLDKKGRWKRERKSKEENRIKFFFIDIQKLFQVGCPNIAVKGGETTYLKRKKIHRDIRYKRMGKVKKF